MIDKDNNLAILKSNVTTLMELNVSINDLESVLNSVEQEVTFSIHSGDTDNSLYLTPEVDREINDAIVSILYKKPILEQLECAATVVNSSLDLLRGIRSQIVGIRTQIKGKEV